MIQDLESKQVNWALVCNHYMDNRPELKFEVTHAVLWNYVVANFETVPINIDQQVRVDAPPNEMTGYFSGRRVAVKVPIVAWYRTDFPPRQYS